MPNCSATWRALASIIGKITSKRLACGPGGYSAVHRTAPCARRRRALPSQYHVPQSSALALAVFLTEATVIGPWVVPRWRLEVTFEEIRAHWGVEVLAVGGSLGRQAALTPEPAYHVR